MSSQISTLPVWKKNASAEERFQEFAMMAREQPAKFVRFALIAEEHLPDGNVKYHNYSYDTQVQNGMTFLEAMAMFELGKIRAYENAQV